MNHNLAETKRQQTSVLTPLERRALHWLASHMPARVSSDQLTLLGFISLATAGLAYALSNSSPLWLHAVNTCLLLNWFGDSLDGTLARYRNRLRPRYGFYVDHITDTLGSCLLLLGMAWSPYMSGRVALALLIAYFMLSINSYLATHALGTFKLSFWRFSPTELRLLLGVGNLVLLFHPTARIAGTEYLLFDVGGVIAAVLLLVTFLVSAVLNTITLYHLEPPAGHQL